MDEKNHEPGDVWTPLYRVDLEEILASHAYTDLHVFLLSWLIWLSLLSGEEVLRVLSIEEASRSLVTSKHDLSEQIAAMKKRRVIDAVRLREPHLGMYERYYVTDLGLYLYLSAVHPSPPLSPARLAKAYPVTRSDLLARLAHPQTHVALSDLVTRLIEEGEHHGYQLVSYQQPWRHMDRFGVRRTLVQSDAALLLNRQTSIYAFLVYVDLEPHQKAERTLKKMLEHLLDVRTSRLLYHQSWPDLLIISTFPRLSLWSQLLRESHLTRMTRPLSGGITTRDAMATGISPPIWWDLESLALAEDGLPHLRLPLSDLLRHAASDELAEQISQRRRFSELRLKDAASPPPRTRHRLNRYVGDSLTNEARTLTRDHLTTLFRPKRSEKSVEGTGLLSLALTAPEKEILTRVAHHPLLDIFTLQAMLRPASDARAIKPLQRAITHLFTLHLIETRIWPAGKGSGEQQRYLLTPEALRFMAIRSNLPFSHYFILPKYQQGDDEQLDRQWGIRGLAAQLWHTHGLYTMMGHVIRGAHERGEIIVAWKSARESVLSYSNIFSQEREKALPDATLIFAASAYDAPTTILLEYDRGTMGEHGYLRKFKAYLDYQLATGLTLPLILVVTTSPKAAQRIQKVLRDLGESLRVVIVLEDDILAHGLTLALRSE